MYFKLTDAHLVGNFTSALFRPVFDLGHFSSRCESSVKPKGDSEEENGMDGASVAPVKDQTPTEEEALRKLKVMLNESGHMCWVWSLLIFLIHRSHSCWTPVPKRGDNVSRIKEGRVIQGLIISITVSLGRLWKLKRGLSI